MLERTKLLPQMHEQLDRVLGSLEGVSDRLASVKALVAHNGAQNHGSIKAFIERKSSELVEQVRRENSDHLENLERKNSEHLEKIKDPRGKATKVDSWLIESCGLDDEEERKEIVDCFVNPAA